MNKKVLYSIVMIAIVISLAIAGTYAYLTATRTTSTNRFAAGTLDLDVASGGVNLEPFVIENLGNTGDISGEKTWTVKNTGSLPGRLLIRLQGLDNKENGCNDQEKMIEQTCTADDEGELGNVITLKIAMDGDDQVQSTLADNQEAAIGAAWSALPQIIMQPNETRTIKAYWATDEDAYSNEVQSDDLRFDMNFRLVQQIRGAGPAN